MLVKLDELDPPRGFRAPDTNGTADAERMKLNASSGMVQACSTVINVDVRMSSPHCSYPRFHLGDVAPTTHYRRMLAAGLHRRISPTPTPTAKSL